MMYRDPIPYQGGRLDPNVMLYSSISPSALRLYVVLCYLDDQENWTDKALADLLGMSVRNLIELRNELKKEDLIAIHRQGKSARIAVLGNSQMGASKLKV